MSPSVPPDRRHLTVAAAGSTAGEPLAALGWDLGWADAARAAGPAGWVPGRVARADRGRALVVTATQTGPVALVDPDVTTGDWLLLEPGTDRTLGTVRARLPRRTALVRGGGRRDAQAQLLVANVDVVLVVLAMSTAPDLGRLDRLLTVAWSSGAQPVVALTKADLSRTAAAERDEVAEAAPGVPVVLTSTLDGRGLDELRGQLGPGRTLALLGASGVGKSSLVNALAGTEVAAVAPIRADGKGRHTTVARELVVLPGLGVLVDTPGLRGVQLWAADDGLDRTFADVVAVARGCRFGDCTHHTEPGCAVTEAVGEGRLSARRVHSYARLQRENAWLQRRYDARQRAEQRHRWREQVRLARQRRRR